VAITSCPGLLGLRVPLQLILLLGRHHDGFLPPELMEMLLTVVALSDLTVNLPDVPVVFGKLVDQLAISAPD